MWVAYLHFFISLSQFLYPWITWHLPKQKRNTCDMVFIAIMCAIYLHWMLFKNECILSYWEKKEIDSSYRLGECPYLHPFVCKFKLQNKHLFMPPEVVFLAVLVVIARVTSIGIGVKVGIVTGILLIQLYVKIKRPTHPTERCALLQSKACNLT